MRAGWLLAFTLSLDDLVIASFVSGPGSNTLPMLIVITSYSIHYTKLYDTGVAQDYVALDSMDVGYDSLSSAIDALDSCGAAGMPPCSGSYNFV